MFINKVITSSSQETEALGKEFCSKLDTPAFVALYGDLGAGKTAFVKGMISSFDSDSVVTSPTYNIVNCYENNGKSFYHFDMYRVTSDDDLYSVGFYDYLDDGIVVTEWSENISYALPDKYYKVTILKTDDDTKREIALEMVE